MRPNAQALLVATFVLTLGGAAFADTPIAPLAPPSRQQRKTIRTLKRLHQYTPPEVPTARAVGVPAYHRSWVLQDQEGMGHGFRVVTLVSRGTPTKVIAFYKKVLTPKGYSLEVITRGKQVVFHKGPKERAPLYMDQPSVGIYPSDCGMADHMRYARTVCRKGYSRVVITYRAGPAPKKKTGAMKK